MGSKTLDSRLGEEHCHDNYKLSPFSERWWSFFVWENTRKKSEEKVLYKKILFLVFFYLLSILFVKSLFAIEFNAFGPTIYERSKGSPITETKVFGSPVEGSDFVLKIDNGNDFDNHRVTSGTIFLNGEQLVGPSDFNEQVEWIERTVSLLYTNELSVKLAGAPGDFLTISFVGDLPLPTVGLSSDPETIKVGELATLTWQSTNAFTGKIDPEIGEIPVNGTFAVSPEKTTTYTITVTSPVGTAQDTVTVNVISPPPTVSITADPDTIEDGESATLTWTSTNAKNVVIDQNIGGVTLNGSMLVSPEQDTTYTITATGLGGTATANVTILVTSSCSSQTQVNASDAGWARVYGKAVAISGDRAIVGTPFSPYTLGSGGSKGTAYILKRENMDWVEEAFIRPNNLVLNDNFGNSVSISGNYAIIGAYADGASGYAAGAAYIFHREGAEWAEQAKLIASDAAPYDKFGSSVSISGDYVIVGTPSTTDRGTYTGSVYIFKRNGETWTEQAKLIANDTAGGDQFGVSVSISGDYAVVGAKWDDDNGWSSGSAYIFKRDGEIWTEQTKLIASDGWGRNYFGTSVSISEDFAIISAPGYEGRDSGSAYIFKRDGEIWTEQAKLTASDGAYGDNFGTSVSIDGDIASIGAPGDDDQGSNSGSAYIFRQVGSDWIEQTKLTDCEGAEEDEFGWSIAISGNNAITGAPNDDDFSSDSGSAFIYEIPNVSVKINVEPELIQVGESALLTWNSINADSCIIEPEIGSVTEEGSLLVSPLETTKYKITCIGPQGSATERVTVKVDLPPPAVTLSSNTNIILNNEPVTLSWSTTEADFASIDQGIGNVAVTGSITVSPTETTTYTVTATGPGGISTASVTISIGIPTLSENRLRGSDSSPEEVFGFSVDISGDSAIVGAPLDDGGGLDWGSASLFKRDGTAWVEQGKVFASDGETDSSFGSSVSISGDYAIVGAPNMELHDYGYDGRKAGAAYIFKRNGLVWEEQGKLIASDPKVNGNFGHSVAIDGDYVIVGAPGVAVYIFKRKNSIWFEQAKLTASDAGTSGVFGYYVDISGDHVIVSGSGSYIFKRDGSSWTEQTKLIPQDGQIPQYRSVSISGEYAILGAPDSYESAINAGAAYIFKNTGYEWVEQGKLTDSDPAYGDGFGASVAISDDSVVISAPGDDANGKDSGAAYIFKRNGGIWIEQLKLVASNAMEGDALGNSVGISGNSAIVGVSRVWRYTGAAYIYTIPPFVNVNAEVAQELIPPGDSTTLSWTTINANSCIIEPGIGSVEVNGSLIISPTETTTYTFIATGTFGTSTESVTVKVGYPEPTVNIYTTPTTIGQGESTALFWSSTDADSVIIEPAVGSVAANGSIAVSPSETTTYTITATGLGGSVTASIKVTVVSPPTVNFNATPVTIVRGESTTLSWNTTNAYSSIIAPTVGNVAVNGWASVSPSETTTYTITATGLGGSTTASISVSVIQPPSVTFNATPTNIASDESSTLSWTITDADSVTIDNGIGAVPLSGSVTVSPSLHTTYTITAVGPGGTITSTVTVLIKPTADISAESDSIISGQSTTISWGTANADVVTIDNGIGGVAANGSITVSPVTTTTYTLTATGLGGSTIAAVTVNILDPAKLGVAIISPTEGETIAVPQTLVKGIVTTTADEVGITVNGIPAHVNGNEFFANNVRLEEGANTITVVATQPDGTTATDTVNVFVDTLLTTNWIELDVNPESGVAPLNATLRVDPHLTFTPPYSAGSYYLAYDGPGNVNITETNPLEFECDFTVPGIYTFTYTVEDEQGIEYTSQPVSVNVLDEAALDALLKTRWNGMKSGLSSQDVEGALVYFLETSKDKYREIYTALQAQLPQTAADMQNIEMIYAKDDRAKYRIIRQQMIEGTPVDITYYIYFNREANGIWKIDEY
jgi:hypothetical protein